ncbi:MAG: cupin domain-containing protein [Bacteroidota bacterium]
MSTDINDSSMISGVLQQSELVQYQTGSVVSRMLVKKPGGNVTAFAFDQGESLSEHIAPFDALALMIEGEAEISISIIAHHVRAGQILLLPAGQPHTVKATTKFKMILIMIKA